MPVPCICIPKLFIPSTGYFFRAAEGNWPLIIGLLFIQLIASACGSSPVLVPLDPNHPASPKAMEGKLHTELLAIASDELPQSEGKVHQQNHNHHTHHQRRAGDK